MGQARRLALLGLERDEEAMLGSMIGSLAPRLTVAWQVTPEAEAEALLIDIDSMYGQMGWLRAQGGPRPIIALTASTRADADARLGRPLDADALLAALTEVATKLGALRPSSKAQTAAAAPAPAARAAPASAPAAPPAAAEPVKPVAVPEPPAAEPPRPRRLVDFLRPGQLAGAVRLRDAEPPLVVDASRRCYLGGAALKPFMPLAGADIEAQRWQTISAQDYERMKAELGEQPLIRLQWLAGLGAGRGTLLPELTEAVRFKLSKYPTTEREFPKHIRIAATLLKQPSTPEEIAAGSGQPVADVIDFINACAAIDLVEAEFPAPPGEPVEPTKGGLLGRLRRR